MLTSGQLLVLILAVVLLLTFSAVLIVRRFLFRKRSDGHVWLSEATIARDLGPLMDPFITADTTIYITGGDGFPLIKRRYPWKRDCLESWLDRGCTIHYILASPPSVTREAFREAAERYPNLSVYVAKQPSEIADPQEKNFVEKLQTFHPTLAETPKGRVMWIEGYHPSNSVLAFNCEFLPPDAANEDRRFDAYRSFLDRICSDHSEKVA